MTETEQVQTLLAELVEHEPPINNDIDKHIARGRRRAYRRTALACVAALVIPAMALGGIYALRPSGEPITVANLPGDPVTGTPTMPWDNTPQVPDLPTDKPTAKSKLLGDQFVRLIPELAEYPEMRRGHSGWTDGKKLTPHLTASASRRMGYRGLFGIGVEIADRKAGTRVPRICATTSPANDRETRCDQIRRLPDGSLAFFLATKSDDSETHAVRLSRPDGIQVLVSVDMFLPVTDVPMALTSPARLLEIARGISVEP